jgi:phenylacetic acid degradation operon negative regulatory protein
VSATGTTRSLLLNAAPAQIRRVICELGLRDSTMAFVGTTATIGITDHEIVRRAWNLEEVAMRYEQLIARFAGADPRPGDELLSAHLQLVDQWTQFPYMDPQLPHDLLPGWIGRRALDVFVGLYRRWAPMAQDRWLEIVEMTSPPFTSASAS